MGPPPGSTSNGAAAGGIAADPVSGPRRGRRMAYREVRGSRGAASVAGRPRVSGGGAAVGGGPEDGETLRGRRRGVGAGSWWRPSPVDRRVVGVGGGGGPASRRDG